MVMIEGNRPSLRHRSPVFLLPCARNFFRVCQETDAVSRNYGGRNPYARGNYASDNPYQQQSAGYDDGSSNAYGGRGDAYEMGSYPAQSSSNDQSYDEFLAEVVSSFVPLIDMMISARKCLAQLIG